MISATEDVKQILIDNLQAMRVIEIKNKQPFKARAYDKVIKQIKAIQHPIIRVEDLDGIDGVGDRIKEKFKTIFEVGFLNAAVSELPNANNERAIEELTKIMAVGMVKARELVEKHGIMTVDELRNHEELLNDKQRLGLKYHEDFLKRIPRKEMDRHRDFIATVIPSGRYMFEISGSYRRGLADSGDIDVLVTSDDPPETAKATFQNIIEKLKASKYLIDEFGFGIEKYLGIARLPRFRSNRRIDIMYVPRERFAFALLYFTGSQAFNISMRNKALELGFSLSEHGLKYSKGARKGELYADRSFATEQDIFEFLKMPYVAPTDRKK